jgi:hypothetical protein
LPERHVRISHVARFPNVSWPAHGEACRREVPVISGLLERCFRCTAFPPLAIKELHF